jgi:hypothetical protein
VFDDERIDPNSDGIKAKKNLISITNKDLWEKEILEYSVNDNQ